MRYHLKDGGQFSRAVIGRAGTSNCLVILSMFFSFLLKPAVLFFFYTVVNDKQKTNNLGSTKRLIKLSCNEHIRLWKSLEILLQ